MKLVNCEIEYPELEDIKIWYLSLAASKSLQDDYKLPLVNKTWFDDMFSAFQITALHPEFGRDVVKAAASIFYKICKRHYRIDGNKRSAVLCLVFFLVVNGYWLKVSPDELYSIAKTVAKSSARSKEKQMKKLTELFGRDMVKMK